MDKPFVIRSAGIALLFALMNLAPSESAGQISDDHVIENLPVGHRSVERSHSGRMQYVTTVHQDGPVGYRDPVGRISPDGKWLAYSAGTRLKVQRIVGGAVSDMGGVSQVRYLSWLPDSRHFVIRDLDTSGGSVHWYIVNAYSGKKSLLWPDHPLLRGRIEGASGERGGRQAQTAPDQLRQLVWSPDGSLVGGVRRSSTIVQLWVMHADGTHARVREIDRPISFPTWNPRTRDFVCLVDSGEHPHIDWTCSGDEHPSPFLEAYGPLVFSPDGVDVYYAAPNSLGTLDLAKYSFETGKTTSLTHFVRDAYAPSVASDGKILFRVQDYRTFIAVVPSSGGPTRSITGFQSETPSWDRESRRIAFTFGTWRRYMDDVHYPDIAQHVGVVPFDTTRVAGDPETVVRASASEDQGMHWSPNGTWIVLHSHADGTDDVWMKPADGSEPAHPISFGGIETGWPRWSPDGRWIVYPTEVEKAGRLENRLMLIGIDQETGEIIHSQQEISIDAVLDGTSVAEWSPDSRRLVYRSRITPGRQGLFVVDRDGGAPRLIHEYASHQRYSGSSVSPGFEYVAFVQPAPDGFAQVFRVPIDGGRAEQLTFDPTDKTQPSWSPDGKWIAFTIFNYSSQFWLLDP